MTAAVRQMGLEEARAVVSQPQRARGLHGFWHFHREHPEVYAALVELAREWRARGRERWSINGAFEVLRWQRRFASLPADHEAFKLNNNYRSRYARLVMQEHPELEGIFETRSLQ